MAKDQLQILLFEKDESIGALLCEFMQMGGFRADSYDNVDEAYKAFESKPRPICVISFEIPSYDEGFELAKKVKSRDPEAILIFMSTNPSIHILSDAYASGADDFIRKPFILEELQMRIMAVLRRVQGVKASHSQSFRIGMYSLNAVKQTLSIGGRTNKITTKECDLLVYLCENMNNLVFREDILRTVWRNDSYYNARSMDVYITKLRSLLKEDKRVGIVNVHGKGYKLLVIEDADPAAE
ncbi:transcriptional regulatory protein RprY [Bacteroidia bacterium]|nr:transcriptional regulatory protein RprY [Bacteroidia bacterium]